MNMEKELRLKNLKFRKKIKPKSKILTLINPALADIHLKGFCQSSSESNRDAESMDTLVLTRFQEFGAKI